jgi:hypothetical protein
MIPDVFLKIPGGLLMIPVGILKNTVGLLKILDKIWVCQYIYNVLSKLEEMYKNEVLIIENSSFLVMR